MKLSPVFKPEDKPTRSGWYCCSSSHIYAENQWELINSHMGTYVYPKHWLWYSSFWGRWFHYSHLCFPLFNQKQYWFGILK